MKTYFTVNYGFESTSPSHWGPFRTGSCVIMAESSENAERDFADSCSGERGFCACRKEIQGPPQMWAELEKDPWFQEYTREQEEANQFFMENQ